MNKGTEICNKIDELVSKYRVMDGFTPYDETDFLYDAEPFEENDFLYPEFYLIKYCYDKYGFNIDLIKNSNSIEEYEKNVNDELEKVKIDHKFLPPFIFAMIYEGREDFYDLIRKLDINDLDLYKKGWHWYADEYLDSYINSEKVKDVLSIGTILYSNKISKNSQVDVIYYSMYQKDEISLSEKCRLIVKDINNYNIEENSFPRKFQKKYDFIFINLEHADIEMLDKTYSVTFDEETSNPTLTGDSLESVINCLHDNLKENGRAILRVPFTYVSKLSKKIIKNNIIDKIVFFPFRKDNMMGFNENTIYVYLVIENNKQTDTIMFLDKNTNETKEVRNETIIKNGGEMNINLYLRNNPNTKRICQIKDDNYKQLKIINEETEFINKYIDEFDFK